MLLRSDSSDNLTARVDELGRRTQWTYDLLGRATSMTLPDPDGSGPLASPVFSYEYNGVGQRIRETDALGRVTDYGYSDGGRRVTVTGPDPDGAGPLGRPVAVRQLDGENRPSQTIDPLGRATTQTYTPTGGLASITRPDPDGAGPLSSPVTQFLYDHLVRPIQETDPLGNVTHYAYENFGRRVIQTGPDPDGAGPQASPVTISEYDSEENLLAVIDPLGRRTDYTYNSAGRLQSVTDPDPDGAGPQSRPVTQRTYDLAGNLRYQTDPLGNVTEYVYDHRNRVVQVIQPDPDGPGGQSSPTTTWTYDLAGNLLSETDPLGRVTQYSYDHLNRRIAVTQPDPDGAGPLTSPVTTFVYDAGNRLISTTDPLGNVTTTQYDHLDRQIAVIQPDPDGAGPLSAPVTTFSYDLAGNLLALTDPVGNTTSWSYDGLGRVTQETNQLGQSRTFVYDSAGNLTRRTDRNGRVIEYGYDNLSRPTSETWKDGATTVRTIASTYDSAGQLLSIADESAAYGFAYDQLGRTTIIAATIANLAPTVFLNQTFDAANRRTGLTGQIGLVSDFANAYTFDNLGRMTRIAQTGQGENAVALKRVDFSYDAASQWQSITRYAALSGTQLVAQTDFTFDRLSRLTALTHHQDTTTLAGYTWAFDAGSRITQSTSTADGTVVYSHDATGQLTGADYDYQADESYSYDPNGNRTNTGYTTGTDNRLTSDGVYTFDYDAEGNRTRRTSLATGTVTEYAWDHRNRLVSVTDRATLGGPATQVVTYAYDFANRLVSRSLDPDGAGAQSAETQYFVYDGTQIVTQFDGPAATDLSHRYLWGPAVDQILADEQVTSPSTDGDILWPLTDNLGTVRDLAVYDPEDDLTTIATHRVYNAYGKLTAETAAVDHLFAFTGRPLDEATGNQWNLHRWYDPTLGRWLSEDPIGFQGGDTNLHRYVVNQPSSSTDANGMQARTPRGGAAEVSLTMADIGITVVDVLANFARDPQSLAQSALQGLACMQSLAPAARAPAPIGLVRVIVNTTDAPANFDMAAIQANMNKILTDSGLGNISVYVTGDAKAQTAQNVDRLGWEKYTAYYYPAGARSQALGLWRWTHYVHFVPGQGRFVGNNLRGSPECKIDVKGALEIMQRWADARGLQTVQGSTWAEMWANTLCHEIFLHGILAKHDDAGAPDGSFASTTGKVSGLHVLDGKYAGAIGNNFPASTLTGVKVPALQTPGPQAPMVPVPRLSDDHSDDPWYNGP